MSNDHNPYNMLFHNNDVKGLKVLNEGSLDRYVFPVFISTLLGHIDSFFI